MDLEALQEEVVRQQGNISKACHLLQASSDSSPVSPKQDGMMAGIGPDSLDWSKAETNEGDSLYGSMQSGFTNLDLDPSTSGGLQCCEQGHCSTEAGAIDIDWNRPFPASQKSCLALGGH